MKTIDIKLWGDLIGRASLKDDNTCLFQYDDKFIKKGIEISPICMPLSNAVYSFRLSDTFKGLPGLLADSLPDKFGNAVIDSWLEKRGIAKDSFSSLERLCYIGTRGMGALEYFPSLTNVDKESSTIEIDNIVSLCNEILSNRQNILINEKEDYINQLISIGTSAGGARAKAIVAYNKDLKIFKSGQIDAGNGYEYYIIKFGNIKNNSDKEENDDNYHTRIEYAYYLLAKHVGITMSDSFLINNNGYHFMTKRFDRFINNKGKMEKIHMQTLGGLAHFDFNIPGIISYEEVVPIMQKLGLTFIDIEEFYRRMVFNVIYRNQDDHVKNISFLMNKSGIWNLSPAYDVTFAFNPQGVWTGQHQMTINGKRKNITYDDLLESGKLMGINIHKCKSIIEKVLEGKNKWPDFAKESCIPQDISNAISNKFISL